MQWGIRRIHQAEGEPARGRGMLNRACKIRWNSEKVQTFQAEERAKDRIGFDTFRNQKKDQYVGSVITEKKEL